MGWTFEFDRAKSETNRTKHGIDFAEAQRLWADSEHLEIPARSTGEPALGRHRADRRTHLVRDRHEASRIHPHHLGAAGTTG